MNIRMRLLIIMSFILGQPAVLGQAIQYDTIYPMGAGYSAQQKQKMSFPEYIEQKRVRGRIQPYASSPEIVPGWWMQRRRLHENPFGNTIQYGPGPRIFLY